MNSCFFTILIIIFLQFPLNAQVPIPDKFKLIESAIHISEPFEIEKKLMRLMDKDSVVLITFSKSTGVMLNHVQTTKTEVLYDLAVTGFVQRYFVLLIDRKAIIYMDN